MLIAEAYPIVRLQPEYVHRTSWAAHIPFAMLLADLLRPGRFVELGTYYGVSYMAFCQAFKSLGLQPACTAVDTWEGDPQIGWYADEVLETLQKAHDPAYGAFSSLVRTTFDEAVRGFADGSIDLLHIDGYHTYDVVRHDFETWLPKMSNRGVVLLHDTSERNEELDFGVWRLWSELKDRYPSFEFTHEHGLGVLGVGTEYPAAMDVFFKANSAERQRIRWQFCELALSVKDMQIGAAEAGPMELAGKLQEQVQRLEHLAAGQDTLIGQLREQVATLEMHGAGLEAYRDLLQRQLDEALARSTSSSVVDHGLESAQSQVSTLRDELVQARRSAEAAETAFRRVERERLQLYEHLNMVQSRLNSLQQQVAGLTSGLTMRRIGLRGLLPRRIRRALRFKA